MVTSKRLVELYNRIHQFDTWAFAILNFDGEITTVSDGDIHIGRRYLLRSLKIHIMCKVVVARDAVDIAREKHSILQRYEEEIKAYLDEEEEHNDG